MNSAPKPRPIIATLTFRSKLFLGAAFAVLSVVFGMTGSDSTKLLLQGVCDANECDLPRRPVGREYLLRSSPAGCNRRNERAAPRRIRVFWHFSRTSTVLRFI